MALSDYSLKKLKEEKAEGFLTYGSGAQLLGSGASGAGAYRNAMAVASGWHGVEFLQVVGVGSSSLPDPLVPSASYGVASGYVVGGSTPIGDVRGGGVEYIQSNSFAVGGTDPFVIPRGTEIVTALYAQYEGVAGASTDQFYTGKIGVGTSAGDVTTYGHYELTGTTPELHEFEAVYPIDTGSLASVTIGSGVYLTPEVTVEREVTDPLGDQLITSADIKASALVSGVQTSILNADGTLKFHNYRENEGSSFTFTRRDNTDVFGTYTNNFGIRTDVVSYNGDIHRSDYFVYTNFLKVNDVRIQDASGVKLNQTTENWTPPPTGAIGSREDAIKAISGFNQQPVYDSNGTPLSGATGYIEFQFDFENDPTYTTYGDLTLFGADTPNFATNEASLVGDFPSRSNTKGTNH